MIIKKIPPSKEGYSFIELYLHGQKSRLLEVLYDKPVVILTWIPMKGNVQDNDLKDNGCNYDTSNIVKTERNSTVSVCLAMYVLLLLDIHRGTDLIYKDLFYIISWLFSMKSDYYDEHLNFSLVKCIFFRFPFNDIWNLSLLPKQNTMKRLFFR